MIVTSGRATSVDQNRYERMYVFRFSFPSKVKFLFRKGTETNDGLEYTVVCCGVYSVGFIALYICI